jgi:hypothetical protein
MATLEDLPPDQRAVLQLVLQRGRSYDDIASLLSIDRAAVRQRALAAFDALGPNTRVEPQRRALIADYLLGQLPDKVADSVHQRLAESAGERAWARVLAGEVAPLATAHELPEIPAEARAGAGAPAVDVADDAAGLEPALSAGAPATAPAAAGAAGVAAADAAPAGASAGAPAGAESVTDETPRIPPDYGLPQPEPAGAARARSSRTGGAILLALGALIVVAIIVIAIATGGSKHKKTTAARTRTVPAATSGTGTTAQPVAQINLTSPNPNAKTAGIAQVVRSGAQEGIVIAAAGVPPNTKHDAYAVWLYKSPTKAKILGFVNPGVGTNGKLSTAGALPTDAAQYSQLLVTLETQASPRQPGRIVLQGQLSLGG